ncbi:YcxB family protein [Christensenellaceae bacterium OttesenSCG-928-K19]|nr:YcxB family protein [Christensenellaceae bacterium OttesenSCG-928-K19]
MDCDASPIRIKLEYRLSDIRKSIRPWAHKWRVLMMVLALAFWGFGVYLTIGVLQGGSGLSLLVAVLLLALGGFFLFGYFLFSGLVYTRRRYEKDIAAMERKLAAEFYDGYYLLVDAKDSSQRVNGARYADLLRVVETTDAFYVYHAEEEFLILAKDLFTAGTPGQLRELLQSRLEQENYKVI